MTAASDELVQTLDRIDFNADPSLIAGAIAETCAGLAPEEAWRIVCTELSARDVPFPIHLAVHRKVFASWDRSRGPAPVWTPTDEEWAATNIAQLMNQLGIAEYRELHRWSVDHRFEFWQHMIRALGITFMTPADRLIGDEDQVETPDWLPGARLNIVDSCFGDDATRPAVIHGGEDGTIRTLSQADLESLTNRVADGLLAAGFAAGDAIAIDMPMTVESVAIYLGIIRAGCVVVSIADSFAPAEIAARLRIAGANGIFTQDVIHRGGKTLPLYQKVVEADGPRAIVLTAGDRCQVDLRPDDLTWKDFLIDDATAVSASCAPSDATNVLFSSGTTGDPKAIPWTHTTPIKCAADGWLHHDIRPGDVVAWPTNLGWMMGPWLIYASLINDATIALYDGAPTTRGFCQFVEDAKVTMLGVVPSLVKAWRLNDLTFGLDWTAIRCFSSTGECSNAEDMFWLMSRAGYRPVIEYCGGTEIGGGYITGTMVQPAAPATFSTPALGLDVVILDPEGQESETGELFLVPPSIGLSNTLLNRDHHEVYFKGVPRGPGGELLRRHGDEMRRLGGGYFQALGRADDTMNLGGIKISSAEIERVVNGLEGIRETAAIAVPPDGGGPDQLVIFAVPEPEADLDPGSTKIAMQNAIRQGLNPLFRVHEVVVVESLPRTASNKVMRRELRGRIESALS